MEHGTWSARPSTKREAIAALPGKGRDYGYAGSLAASAGRA